MKASKIKKKLLVSVLCAGLLFQSMPMEVLASSEGVIVENSTETDMTDEVSEAVPEEPEYGMVEGSETKGGENGSQEDETHGTENSKPESDTAENEGTGNTNTENSEPESDTTENEGTESTNTENSEPESDTTENEGTGSTNTENSGTEDEEGGTDQTEEQPEETTTAEETETEETGTEELMVVAEGEGETPAEGETPEEGTTEEYIDMVNEFPDENFRKLVLDGLNISDFSEETKITREELSGIKEILYDGSKSENRNKVIKDIKGMELLTGVTKVGLPYNEISDVQLVWSMLGDLETLNLCGNEITKAPSLKENRSLTTVDFRENMMSDSECRRLRMTQLPLGCELASETAFTQRTNGFSFVTEDTYYIVGNQCPIVVKIGGYKSGIKSEFAFSIDGDQVELTNQNKSEYVYWMEDSKLEEGEHEIRVILQQEGTVKGEATKTFNVARQDCYAGQDSYRFSTNSDDDKVDLYYPYSSDSSKYISRITFIDEQGKEYTYNGLVFNTDYANADYRYTDIEGNKGQFIKENYMNHTQFSMKNIITELPSGVYDLKADLAVTSGEGYTPYILTDLIEIRSEVTNNWKYSITGGDDEGVLYYNDPDRNTATILVTDNGNIAPVFSKNSTLNNEYIELTITVDPLNRNQAFVTITPKEGAKMPEGAESDKPVSEEVTIKVGNSIQRVKFSIKKRVYAETVEIKTEVDENGNKKPFEIGGIGKIYSINVDITPAEALQIREDVIVTLSDTSVAEVERWAETPEGIAVTLRSKNIGTTDITVKIPERNSSGEVVDDSYIIDDTWSVMVTRGSFSEAEKNILKQNVGVLYAITNITTNQPEYSSGYKLGNVSLPQGWAWTNPDTELTADDDVLVKYYEAGYTQDSFTPFTTMLPVTVTEITGVSLSGDNELTSKHSGFCELQLEYKGYQIESNRAFIEAVDKAVTYNWTADSLFTLKPVSDRKVKVEAAEVSDVTDGAVRLSVTAGEDQFTAEFAIRVLTEHITNIVITPMSAPSNPAKFKHDKTEGAVYVDESSVSAKTNAIRLVASATMDENDVRVVSGTLKWEVVTGTDLARITELSNGMAQLTILQSGTIIVRATAQDVGEKYAELPIEVRDYKPFLEQKAFTISKYSETGVELPVYAVEGNTIINISVDEDASFKVDNLNGKFVLSLKNPDAFIEKSVVKTTMHIRTQMSIGTDEEVTITVDVKKPKATFKVSSAANIFYTDTAAVYSVSSEYNVKSIRPAEERTTGFVVTGYDSGTRLLTIGAKGLNKDSINEFKAKGTELCKVRMLVTYEDYGTHTETITISPKNTKPKYKIADIYTLGTVRTAVTYVTDTSSKAEFALPGTLSVSTATTDTSVEKEEGRLRVTYTGKNSRSYKVTMSDPAKWTSDVSVTGKFTIVGSLNTQLGTTGVSLNMAHNSAVNGMVSVPVSVKNNTMGLERITYEAADKKTAALLESGYLQVDSRDPAVLRLGLAGTIPESVKAGTYKLNVGGTVRVNGIALQLKMAKLSVVVVAAGKVPSVNLTKKGSINLVDRANTSIIYTPKVNNMTAGIVKVGTGGEYAGYFTAALKDGKIVVKAVEGVSMRTNIKYPLVLRMQFDNSTVVSKTVSIQPTNKNPKIKASATKGTIYKVSANSIRWTVNNAGDFGRIEEIVMVDDKASLGFNMKVTNRNEVVLSLKPEVKRTIKKGKYTISYQVKMRDAAENVKPVTLKMTVTVK